MCEMSPTLRKIFYSKLSYVPLLPLLFGTAVLGHKTALEREAIWEPLEGFSQAQQSHVYNAALSRDCLSLEAALQEPCEESVAALEDARLLVIPEVGS